MGTPTPATKPAPATTPAVPAPTMSPTSLNTLENSGLMTIYVPAEAKVTINGLATRSTGSRRQYVSFGLKPGFSYKYVVHAEIVRDGKIVEEDKTVTLTAGQQTGVAFGFNVKTTEAWRPTDVGQRKRLRFSWPPRWERPARGPSRWAYFRRGLGGLVARAVSLPL